MKVQIGSPKRVRDFGLFPPSSKGMGNFVAERVEDIVQRANVRHTEALQIDGINYALWRFIPRTGKMCTCSLETGTTTDDSIPDVDVPDVIDSDGDGIPDDVDDDPNTPHEWPDVEPTDPEDEGNDEGNDSGDPTVGEDSGLSIASTGTVGFVKVRGHKPYYETKLHERIGRMKEKEEFLQADTRKISTGEIFNVLNPLPSSDSARVSSEAPKPQVVVVPVVTPPQAAPTSDNLQGKPMSALDRDALYSSVSDAVTQAYAQGAGGKLGDISSPIFSEDSSLWGGDLTRCGICFGSRYEESYQFQAGKRTILTSRSNWFGSGYVTVDRNTQPFTFHIADGGSVRWNVQTLADRIKVWGLAVLNNLNPATNARLEMYQAGEWVELTPYVIPSGPVIQVRVVQANLAQEAVFTHVEWHTQTRELPYLQMENWADEENIELFESLATASMELGADVGPATKGSIIYDSKYDQLWKVVASTPKRLGTGLLYGTDLNVRLVQKTEQIYQLHSLIHNQYIR